MTTTKSNCRLYASTRHAVESSVDGESQLAMINLCIKLKQSEEFLRYGNHMIREKSLRVIRKRSSADNQSVAFGTSERAAAVTILPRYCDIHNRTTNIENIINSSISSIDTNRQYKLNSRKIHFLVISLNNIYDRRCILS